MYKTYALKEMNYINIFDSHPSADQSRPEPTKAQRQRNQQKIGRSKRAKLNFLCTHLLSFSLSDAFISNIFHYFIASLRYLP